MKEMLTNMLKDNKQRTLLFASLASLAVGLGLIGALIQPRLEATRVVQIQITSQGFEPASVVVTPGTEVVWVNTDVNPHKVASNPYPTNSDLPGLLSVNLGKDDHFSFSFARAGTFSYHDEINPAINGTITVK
jgi:plastocyanin